MIEQPSVSSPAVPHNPSSVSRRLFLTTTLAGAAVQINLLVNMVLATGEGTGAVSWLGYAFRVMYLPIGLFGVSIATATLPAVSRHAAQKQACTSEP